MFEAKATERHSLLACCLLAMCVLSACAGVTDVVPTGADTFMVASHGTMGWSSGPAQKAAAMKQAGDYCRSSGKDLQVINSTDSGNGEFGKISSGEVQFKCVKP